MYLAVLQKSQSPVLVTVSDLMVFPWIQWASVIRMPAKKMTALISTNHGYLDIIQNIIL